MARENSRRDVGTARENLGRRNFEVAREEPKLTSWVNRC